MSYIPVGYSAVNAAPRGSVSLSGNGSRSLVVTGGNFGATSGHTASLALPGSIELANGEHVSNRAVGGDIVLVVRLKAAVPGAKKDTKAVKATFLTLNAYNTLLADWETRQAALIRTDLVPTVERNNGGRVSAAALAQRKSAQVSSSFEVNSPLVPDESGSVINGVRFVGIVACDKSPVREISGTGGLQDVTVQVISSNAGTKVNNSWIASDKGSLGVTKPAAMMQLFIHIGRSSVAGLRATQVISFMGALSGSQPYTQNDGSAQLFPNSFEEAVAFRQEDGRIAKSSRRRTAVWLPVGMIKDSGNLPSMVLNDEASLRDTGSLLVNGAAKTRVLSANRPDITCVMVDCYGR